MIGSPTGLLDRNGRMIRGGDAVALDGETDDGTPGPEPSGFFFDPTEHVFRVVWDEAAELWRLAIPETPETPAKFVAHANGLLLSPWCVEVVESYEDQEMVRHGSD